MLGHGVRGRQSQDRATTGGDHAPNGMKQQRAGGNRLHVLGGTRQAGEYIPPVIDQGNQPGHDAAAIEVVGHETGPSPWVFDLIQDVFAVRPVPVQLAQRLERQVIIL